MVKKSLTEEQVSMLESSMRVFGEEDDDGSSGEGYNVSRKKEEAPSTSTVPSFPLKDEIIIEQPITSSQSLIKTPLTYSSEPSQLEPLSTLLSNFENLPKCLSLYGQNYHLIDSENIDNSEPKITNYGLYFKGILDYIFYILNQEKENINKENDHIQNSKDNKSNLIEKVKVSKLLKLPRKEEFELTSLPNYKFNSDHVCLMVEIVGLDG